MDSFWLQGCKQRDLLIWGYEELIHSMRKMVGCKSADEVNELGVMTLKIAFVI